MIEVEMPDGVILEFPAGTNEAVIDRAAKKYIQGNRTAQAGARIIATTDNGGKIFEMPDGRRLYADKTMSVSDQSKVAKIMEGATAADLSMQGFDQSTLEQAGAAKYAVPFVRGTGLGSYVDEGLGLIDPDIQQGMRATAGAMERQNPKTNLALNVGGGVTSAAQLAATLPNAVIQGGGRLLASNSGRVLPSVVKGVTAGAPIGAVSGGIYGYGEGTDPESRMSEAKSGAEFGALAGSALGLLAPMASRGMKNIADYVQGTDIAQIASYFGISRNAANVIKATFDRGGNLDAATENIKLAGEQGMVADAGHAAQAMLDAAASSGGAAGQTVRDSINQRTSTSVNQLETALNETLGDAPLGPRAAVDAIGKRTSAARSDAYNAAYTTPISYAAPEGREILSVLSRIPGRVLSQAVQEANEDMVSKGLKNQQIMVSMSDNGRPKFGELPNVQQLDYIKRALNTLSENSRDTRTGKQTAASLRYGNLARDLRKALGDAIIDGASGARIYDDAVKLGGETIREQNAFKLGRDVLNPKMEIEDVMEELGVDPSDAQIEAAKLGLRSAVRKALDDVKVVPSDPDMAARQLDAFLRITSSTSSRNKIKQILGDESAALLKEMDEVAQTSVVRAGVATNSKTAVRQSIQGDVDDLTAPGPVGSLMRGEPINTTREMVQIVTGQTKEYDVAQRQAIYDDIAKALTQKRGRSAVAALRYLRRAMDGQKLSEPQRQFITQQLALIGYKGAAGNLGRFTGDTVGNN